MSADLTSNSTPEKKRPPFRRARLQALFDYRDQVIEQLLGGLEASENQIESEFIYYARYGIWLMIIGAFPMIGIVSYFLLPETGAYFRTVQWFTLFPAICFASWLAYRGKKEHLLYANWVVLLGLLICWVVCVFFVSKNPDPTNYFVYLPLSLLYYVQLIIVFAFFPVSATLIYFIGASVLLFTPMIFDPYGFNGQFPAFVIFVASTVSVYAFSYMVRSVFLSMKGKWTSERISMEKLAEAQAILNIALDGSPLGLICFDRARKPVLRQNVNGFLTGSTDWHDQDEFERLLRKNLKLNVAALTKKAAHVVIEKRHYMVSRRQIETIDVYSFVDVTEKHEWEASLNSAQKLQIIGELTSGIAHDYNNILAIAMNNLEAFPKVEHRKLWLSYLEPVYNAVGHAKTVSRKLLTIAGKRELDRLEVNVAQVLEGLDNFLQSALGPRIQLEFDLDPTLHIKTDPHELSAAVLNIVINAKNALGKAQGKVMISCFEMNEKCFITVEDNGSGISQKDRKRIFDPFFTTKKDRYSTGLGLSMVKGFVEQSDGQISVRSRPGQTVFTMSFPLCSASADVQYVRPNITDHDLYKDKTILFVDDNPQLLSSMQRLLHVREVPSRFAHGAHEALEIVKTDRSLQVAFLDLSMPEMDGISLGEKIMRFNSDIICYLLTGHASNRLIEEAREKGFRGVIFKPVKADVLLELVARPSDESFAVCSL